MGTDVGGVHVHHGDLPGFVQLGLLLSEQLAGEQCLQGNNRTVRCDWKQILAFFFFFSDRDVITLLQAASFER